MPELDTPDIKRTVFVLPDNVTKNGEAQVVVLNDVAQSVVEEQRSKHKQFVFTFEDSEGERNRVGHFRNSGWLRARERAGKRYKAELGAECPDGFRRVRVHDLRTRSAVAYGQPE